MKQLHRTDLYGWSVFDESRNLDFHGLLWVREGGNVMVDPVTMSQHDLDHVASLGGVATIVVTNSDHARDSAGLAERFGADVVGPAGERGTFPIPCARWIEDGDEIVPGLIAYALEGSKTPGELALLLERSTLITGDLIRCHRGGALCTLPQPKLGDPDRARASVRRLAELDGIETVLVGDGWPVFRVGGDALRELAAAL
jgi:hypothetical protein